MWNFIVPAAASLLGGVIQGSSAKKAAAANAAGQQQAIDLQRQVYEENIARQKPFLDTGTEFFNKLADLHRNPDTGANIMRMDPGYRFRLSEGLKALDRQAAARGGLISGAALRAASQYGQDFASNEFGNAYNRLAQLANTGPRAAGVMSDLGTNYANTMSGVYGNIGQTNANAMLARGSAYGNALGGAARSMGQWWQSEQNNPYNLPNTPDGNMPWGEGPNW